MRILISNKIKIEDYTEEAMQYCRENLILPNPEYYKREAQGRWTGNTQREFVLFERIGHDLLLPFGCLKDLWRLFGGKIDFKPLFSPVEPRNYNSNINLYPYQETAVKRLLSAKNGILVSCCGSGKGLPLKAKIYTPTGWKYNGDLEIGDKVIGSDGKETEVTGIYDKGEVPAYKLTFSDGAQVVCDKDHLWAVQTQPQRSDGKGFYTVNTQSIFNYYAKARLQGRRNFEYYIPVVEPVQFEKKEIPIDAWLLGFLIGDGSLTQTSLRISNSEKDLIEKAEKKVGKPFRKIHKYDYYIPKTSLNTELRNLGLNGHRSYEKFIPDAYKYNDINTRLAVLQGLFDSDGNINKGKYEYSTSSKRLAYDFVEIVQSLGGMAKVVKRTPHFTYKGEYKQGRVSYRIHFKLYKFKPFTSLKHASKYQERILYTKAYRIIKKIEPCKPIISRCITVAAKDELYVTDNFIVTHNTQMALETIARIGGKALWLTHTSELLQQSLDRAKSCFDLPKEAYGTITAGKVNIGTHITFATVQTMRELDLRQYAKEWDVIMVDECHKAVGSPTKVMQFYKVLSNLSARFKFGVTATPKRADGLEKCMFALLGDIVHTISKEAVKQYTCPVKVRKVETGYSPNLDFVLAGDGTIVYSDLINDLTENTARNEKIASDIQALLKDKPNARILVLSDRVAHLTGLKTLLCQNMAETQVKQLMALSNSKKQREARRQVLKDLNDGKINVVLATYALAKEGLDVPKLDYVVFASPQKDPTTVEQSAGRVGRKADGKDFGIVIDYVDDFGMLKGFSKKRNSVYKKLEYEIM